MTAEASPTATVISSRDHRLSAVTIVLIFGACIIDMPFYDRWWRRAHHIPVHVLSVIAYFAVDAYVAIVAFAAIWLLYRGCRLGARFDNGGITVRRILRTDRYRWATVSHFADGYGESQGGRFWALDMVLVDGRPVTINASPKPKTLAAIRQLAVRYGIPAELTGIPREDGRPARTGSVGQQPAESAVAPGADRFALAGWVEATKFAAAGLRPGYNEDEVDAFLHAIRDTFLGLRQPSVTPAEIQEMQFSATRLPTGYDTDEVDAFLKEAGSMLTVRQLAGGGRARPRGPRGKGRHRSGRRGPYRRPAGR